MYVVDEATGKIIPENRSVEVVVGYSSGQLIWGFVNKKEAILPVLYIIKDGVENLPSYEKAVRDIVFFSNSQGLYMCKEGLTESAAGTNVYDLIPHERAQYNSLVEKERERRINGLNQVQK